MTQLLQQAFAKASKLPEVEQNVFARWALEELVSERRWEKIFAASEDMLSRLADAALRERKRGKTKPLNPKTL